MSDMMLIGSLRCPINDHNDIQVMQLMSRAREAADKIEADILRIITLEQNIKKLEAFWEQSREIDKMNFEKYVWNNAK